MPLDDLVSMALFAHVVRLRSFTGAAQQLGLAKSAVSKRISQLEEKIGVRLLLRTTRRLALTAEGMQFYEHCAAVLASAEAARQSIAGASDSIRGVLRVNAPITFTQMYLARSISLFLRQHPEVEVVLSADDRLVDVIEGGFDVVVRITRMKGDSSLVARRLVSDRLVVCGSPDYLRRAGTPQHPDELVQHNCLHYALVPVAGEWRFRTNGERYSVPAKGNFTSSDGTALREAAISGVGLAVLPFFMVAADVASGKLVTVLDEFRKAEIGVFAVYANRKQQPARTRAFLDFLAQYFAEPNWKALLVSPSDAQLVIPTASREPGK